MTTSPAPSIPAPKEKLRFSEVDSLRAVACALVIVFHTATAFGDITGSVSDFVILTRGFGVLGVLLFFAISGYVIPSSLRGGRKQGVKQFAIRRFWRLWPPFWITLFLIYITDFSSFTIKQIGYGTTMFPSLFGVDAVAGHFWTLEIELLFYSAIACLFFIFGRIRGSVIIGAYIGVAIWCLSWSNPPGQEGYWLRSPLFLMLMFYGGFCREIMNPSDITVRLLRKFSRAILLGLGTGLAAAWPIQGAFLGCLEGDFYQVKAGLIMLSSILGFLAWVILKPVKVRPLALIGRWTYSTYLIHWLVIKIIFYRFGSFFNNWPISAYMLLSLTLSLCIGGLFYRWIEQLSDRIGKRIAG